MKFIALFTAQAWINELATTVDNVGPNAWDVTAHVDSTSEELRAEYLSGGNFSADTLREAINAPAWVRAWNGPFEVHVREMEDAEAEAFLQENGVQATGDQSLPFFQELRSLIPDRDGRWGRGVRDGIESMTLALLAGGVDPGLLKASITTVMDALSNNEPDPTAAGIELHDLMIVSTGHLTQEERDLVEADELDARYLAEADPEGAAQIIVSFTADHGWQLYIPSQGTGGSFGPKNYEVAYPTLSPGFAGVIRRAVELGVEYVRFDTDADALDDVPVYP